MKADQRKGGRRKCPAALTIAGSDSGGGAGIQADLKTFAAFGVHGVSAITAVTAQNPDGVRSVQGLAPKIVVDQVRAVFDAFEPKAIKLGMLFSAEITRAVGSVLGELKAQVVIDPVMIATSGAMLLKPAAIRQLVKILPSAALLTPNIAEAEFLLAATIKTPEEMRAAARALFKQHRCPVLMKGGHLKGATAADIFYDGKNELLLEAPYIEGVSTHGTGCTYSAAITAGLALGYSLEEAVVEGKTFITEAIRRSVRCNENDVLNCLWRCEDDRNGS